MSFNLVRLSQQDPRWKAINLGNSSLSIGSYGCALTSVAMYLSGFGYAEDPASLNAKLKARGGFVNAAIVWGAVHAIYPQISYTNLILSHDTDAPIDLIGSAVSAGQPVLLEVDFSPSAGLQTHWVVAYQRAGDDFLILDPWPYPIDNKDVSLMGRYRQGQPLTRTITAAVFYTCQTPGTVTPPPTNDGYYVRVLENLEAGLRLRSLPSTTSDTLTIESAGTYLRVIEPETPAKAKIGVFNQWLQVRDPNARQGFVAAWYVENAPVISPVPVPPPPTPTPTPTPAPTPTPVPVPPGQPPRRSRKSVADGLEAVPLEAPFDELLTPPGSASATARLVASIWNRYGGLLGALSAVLGIQPGAAVAVMAIESGGQGFSADGRMVIRFENHIFYQYWGKNHPDQFAKYFRYNSVQPWTGHQWRPPTSQSWLECHTSLASEWDVFNFACTLDQTAARMSISMGAAQIMGFNYSVIGYSTVDDMYTAFTAGERDQVIGFFDFVEGVLPGAGAVKALQTLNYKAFATSYNGSGQADYYANLMKTANEAFTALHPPVVVPPPVGTPPPVAQPPTQTPPPPTGDTQRITVKVTTNVAKPGLNLRKQPSLTSEILGVEPIGSKLLVLDDPAEAAPRVGKPGEWLLVKDDKGRRGYVSAVYVQTA